MRDITENYLRNPKAEEFAAWAFGDNFKNLVPSERMKECNKRHGELMLLHTNGELPDNIPKMIEI